MLYKRSLFYSINLITFFNKYKKLLSIINYRRRYRKLFNKLIKNKINNDNI